MPPDRAPRFREDAEGSRLPRRSGGRVRPADGPRLVGRQPRPQVAGQRAGRSPGWRSRAPGGSSRWPREACPPARRGGRAGPGSGGSARPTARRPAVREGWPPAPGRPWTSARHEVGAGRQVLRRSLDGLQQVRDGLAHPSLPSEHAAQPRVRLREVGLQGQGLPELDDRFVQPAAVDQGRRQVVVRRPGSPGSARWPCGTGRPPRAGGPSPPAPTRGCCGPRRRPGSTPGPSSAAGWPPRAVPRSSPPRPRR